MHICRNGCLNQIFLILFDFPFPSGLGAYAPDYLQISIKEIAKDNAFYQILSPNSDDQGVWIYQDAWFHLGKFEAGKSDTYEFKKKGNGLYVFVLEGQVEVEGQVLDRRDGLGVWNADQLTVKASADSEVLLMEVPMTV